MPRWLEVGGRNHERWRRVDGWLVVTMKLVVEKEEGRIGGIFIGLEGIIVEGDPPAVAIGVVDSQSLSSVTFFLFLPLRCRRSRWFGNSASTGVTSALSDI